MRQSTKRNTAIFFILTFTFLIAYDIFERVNQTNLLKEEAELLKQILTIQEARKDLCGLAFKSYNITNINGFNSNAKGYYCVLTVNRTAKQIERVVLHEECYRLVFEDKKHFCRN